MKIKIVYVVLEAQYQSSLSAGAWRRLRWRWRRAATDGCGGACAAQAAGWHGAAAPRLLRSLPPTLPPTRTPPAARSPPVAVKRINEGRKEVCVEIVGYLLEELRDAKNYEAFKADVASGAWALAERRQLACGGRGAGACGCGMAGRRQPSHAPVHLRTHPDPQPTSSSAA